MMLALHVRVPRIAMSVENYQSRVRGQSTTVERLNLVSIRVNPVRFCELRLIWPKAGTDPRLIGADIFKAKPERGPSEVTCVLAPKLKAGLGSYHTRVR